MKININRQGKATSHRGYCLLCWNRIYKGQEWCRLKGAREAHLPCAKKVVGITEDPLKKAERFEAIKAGFLENTEKLYRLKHGLSSGEAYNKAEEDFQEIIAEE